MRLLVVVLSLLVASGVAELVYTYRGVEERIPLVQLWFEGHWAKLQPFNGTATLNKHGDLRGKIVILDTTPPVEPIVREVQSRGASALIFTRPGNFPPGFTMYLVTGRDRSDLWLPTMEATFASDKHIQMLAEGSFIQCIPTENLHKKANDTKFQLCMNLILSAWEMAIFIFACRRLYQFYYLDASPLFAIGPLCCGLECIGAALRLAYTCVDPFFTYRILSERTSYILISISWPFSESAGILLTFFWAESLSKSNIKALPFISRYKWAATISVLVIFLIEIVCNILRVTLPLAFAPVYISTAMLFIVTFTLVVCYLSAAVSIGRRIGHHGKSVIRRMTLRIALSSLGYLIIILAAIAFAAVYHYVWGRSMPLNAIFVGFNLASIMQVLALKPMQHSSSQEKHSSSTPSAPEPSNEQGEGVVEEEEHSSSSTPS